MATDANGYPIHFEITGGEVHDCKIAPEIIEQLPSAEHTIADKGYDSEERGMLILTVAFKNIVTWLRIYLQE